MKKILIALIALYAIALGVVNFRLIARAFSSRDNVQYMNGYSLAPISQTIAWGTSFNNGAGINISSTVAMVGWKIYANSACTVTAVDAYLGVTGSPTGIQLSTMLETDASDTPSGTVIASTSAYAGPSSTGFTGLQNFQATTMLTPNTPYWVVIGYTSGTAPSSTVYYSAYQNAFQTNGGILRQYNGTNWTTVASVASDFQGVIKCSDGSYIGVPQTSSAAADGNAVYGSNVMGMKYAPFNVPVKVSGVSIYLKENGAPTSSLDIKVYDNSTLLDTVTIPTSSIISNRYYTFSFTQPDQIAAGDNMYIILAMHGGVGNSSNDYYTNKLTVNSTYYSALAQSGTNEVYGTNSNPTLLTAATTQIPLQFKPILDNPSTDFVSSTASSGSGFKTWSWIF